MEIFEAIVVGLIQGMVEWLPLSSEGVTTLVMVNFFGKPFGQAFTIAVWLHLGTLSAALVYFWREIRVILLDIKAILRKPHEYNYHDEKYLLTSWLGIATIVTIIIGGIIYLFGLTKIAITGKVATIFIGIAMLVTGFILMISKKIRTDNKLKIRDSILLGAVQGLSIIPGISRSGITTSTLMLRRYDAKKALTISFLMSIPAVMAATLGIIIFESWAFGITSVLALILSFLTGFLTIHYFLKLAEKINFAWFAIVLGIVSLLSAFLL